MVCLLRRSLASTGFTDDAAATAVATTSAAAVDEVEEAASY